MARRPRSIRRAERIRAVRPPLRDGLNASPLQLPDGGWATIGEYLTARFGEGGAQLHDGDLYYDHAVPASPSDSFVPGRRLWVFRPVPDEPAAPIQLPIVGRGPGFVVIDKPHALAAIPRGSHVARSVAVAARRQLKNDAVVPAHRLDAATAGLMLLTTEVGVRGMYQRMFDRRQVEKTYLAVAPLVELPGEAGPLEPSYVHMQEMAGSARSAPTGWHRVQLRIEKEGVKSWVRAGDPNALTYIRVARTLGHGLALYELRPVTGRTHQLRVTMEYLGAPILGDPLYPVDRLAGPAAPPLAPAGQPSAREASSPRAGVAAAQPSSLPLQLLAARMAFRDPQTGEARQFESGQTLAALAGREQATQGP